MKTESLAGQGIWALELQENSCLCPLLLRIDWMDSVIFHNLLDSSDSIFFDGIRTSKLSLRMQPQGDSNHENHG